MSMFTDSAVRDRIGKGHNPDIAPLSGIVAKLKAQQQALVAKCVPLNPPIVLHPTVDCTAVLCYLYG